ncbi:hypothetical protein Pelo_19001 [Pelomyxa schiedti]|nr:hypothetical protein Pelo_19001 [Pelomyxa schiedti]
MVACSGNHDNVEFLKWLLQNVGGDLCQDDLVGALHRALAARKQSISRWLEQHITTTTGAKPKVSLSKLPWRDVPTQEDWLVWLLTHSRSCDIDCSPAEVLSVVKASAGVAVKTKVSRAVSVWKRFPLSPVEHHDLLVSLLKNVVEVGSFYELKEVLSFGEFTVDDRSVRSEEQEEESHDESNHSHLLLLFLCMLSLNKRGCAEWLFHKLKFTLPDVRGRLLGSSVDIATWKLILRLFPDITRDVAIKYFMYIIASTPLHAQFTINNTNLGITLDDIKDFCCSKTHLQVMPSYPDLSQTRWWLDHL